MGDLPINLPTNIRIVLESINFNIDDSDLKSPFYFATYSEVKMKGWDTAHLYLKGNLENLIQILEKDECILNKEKKIQTLNSEVAKLSNIEEFYTEHFYNEHRKKYLRIVKKLTQVKKPLNHFNFSELVKANGRTLKNNDAKKTNANIKEYIKIYRRVNPKYLLRHPISELYEYFNGELKKVYENNNIRKYSLDKGHDFLKRICLINSKGLMPKMKFTPFGYISVPEHFTGNESELRIFSGKYFGGLAGKGGVKIYKRTGSIFEFQENFNQ